MLYLLHVETVRCSPGGDGDGDGQRLYNCADNGLVGGAGRARLLHRCSAMILLMETRWLAGHCNSLIVMMKYSVKKNISYI